MSMLLVIFISLRVLQLGSERYLAWLNHRYYAEPGRKESSIKALGITSEDWDKSLAYSQDKYNFGRLSVTAETFLGLAFIALGGLGWVEAGASQISVDLGMAPHGMGTGILFFLALGGLSSLLSLPFEVYRTFVIEEKHGFNRQSLGLFAADRLKGLAIAVLLGTPLIAAILWIMENAGTYWWVLAWMCLSGFSLLTAWLYPTLLAPLFNKFKPLPDGELKDDIVALSQKIGFKSGGLSIMDASKRSSHGNAYFTGLFGDKKIVLFDTLVESLQTREIVAVLAHELGHFKLNHVRWSLIRGILMTGLIFYLLSLALPLRSFYEAFAMQPLTSYGALTVFSLWFGLISFLMQPMEAYLSRRNEFAADRFASEHYPNGDEELARALIKLREKSKSMPIVHPWYSRFYLSHPPIMERLAALGQIKT